MRNFASNNVNVAVGRRLAAVRGKVGLSQKDFAAKLKVSLRAYQSYERGEREVSAMLVRALFIAFQVEPVWLLLGAEKPPTETDDDGTITVDKQLFLEVLNRLEDYAQQHHVPILGADKLGRLAMIVYGRVAHIDSKDQLRAVTSEVKQVFEILEYGERDPGKQATKSRVAQLSKEWVRLEVASQIAFAKLTTLERLPFFEYIARDLSDKKELMQIARWKLRERLLLDGLISYDAKSIERFTPINEKQCAAWLEDQCKKLRSHLDELRREIAEHEERDAAHSKKKAA